MVSSWLVVLWYLLLRLPFVQQIIKKSIVSRSIVMITIMKVAAGKLEYKSHFLLAAGSDFYDLSKLSFLVLVYNRIF